MQRLPTSSCGGAPLLQGDNGTIQENRFVDATTIDLDYVISKIYRYSKKQKGYRTTSNFDLDDSLFDDDSLDDQTSDFDNELEEYDDSDFSPIEIDSDNEHTLNEEDEDSVNDDNKSDEISFGSKNEKTCTAWSGSCWLSCSGSCNYSYGGPINLARVSMRFRINDTKLSSFA